MLCQLIISSDIFNIFFRTLIINIYWLKIIENLDNSTDYYGGYIQNIMILQVIQHLFSEILIGGRKTFNSDIFFAVTNIRTNVHNDSSEFEGLLHKMMSQKPFINQETCHINLNGEKSYALIQHT